MVTRDRMALAKYLPLFGVALLLLPLFLAPVSARAERAVSGVSLSIFRGYVEGRPDRIPKQRLLESAHVGTVYRVYASKTLFYALLVSLASTILGVYVLTAFYSGVKLGVDMLPQDVYSDVAFLLDPVVEPGLDPVARFAVVSLSSAAFGLSLGYATYLARWWLPRNTADARKRQIDMGLMHAVSLMYALSHGGVPFPEVMRTLANNRAVYGEVAEEFEVTVREMEVFGLDMFAAVDRMAARTPSQKFAEFSKNLSTVIEGGKKIPEFLEDQYENYYDEVEDQQEAFLEILAGLSEGYVGLLVAGPLFLITVLIVMGLVMGNTLLLLRLIVYIFLPLLTLGFMLYLSGVMGALRTERKREEVEEEFKHLDGIRRSDADLDEEGRRNLDRLRTHRGVSWILDALFSPIENFKDRPEATLYLTLPAAAVYVLYSAWAAFRAGDLSAAAMDDPVVQSTILVLAVFGVFQEFYRRKEYRIEAVIPAFLDQLASINEAGRPLAQSIGRISEAEVGPLAPEVRRAWRDIQWHGSAINALRRMEQRIRTEGFTRVVVLTTQAMRATGDLQGVLRIASDDADTNFRLRKRSRERTFTYLIVVYISFFVFLGIIAVLRTVFIPNIPTADIGAVGGGGFGQFTLLEVAQRDAYVLVLFHSALIQGVCSGLVAGQIGERSVKNGAKHAAVLLTLAYVVFLLFR